MTHAEAQLSETSPLASVTTKTKLTSLNPDQSPMTWARQEVDREIKEMKVLHLVPMMWVQRTVVLPIP